MRSELFGENLEAGTQDRFALQNPRLLRIGLDGDVMARQGSMVAYQGELDFAHQGSGGVGRFLKKSLTGEGVPLMKVSGRGDLFLADDASEIHLITLEGDSVTVNGRNVLAFDSALSWDIKKVEGASMLAGGVFNTVFTGTGQVAITAHGTPVWFASEFAIENRWWIRQHPLGLLTREGGSDHDRARAWQRPAGPARQAVLDTAAEVRDLAAVGPPGDDHRGGRRPVGVDRSTIMRLRTVAKDGALQALAESKPGVQQARRDLELEAARAEAARLGEALKEMAVKLMLIEGKGRWG